VKDRDKTHRITGVILIKSTPSSKIHQEDKGGHMVVTTSHGGEEGHQNL
jgi:hypothetical protein